MNKDKRKKRIKICTALIVSVLAFATLIMIAFPTYFFKIGFTDKVDGIYYFPEDYDENIFKDVVYMNKSRKMKMDQSGTTVFVDETNYNVQTRETQFFYEYFQCVINGKYEEYSSFFTESFFRQHTIPEKFTMQKIYDIDISLLSSDVVDSVSYETYKVGYRIYENNGSFRADVKSEECKPIAITISKGQDIKISAMVPIVDGKKLD